MDNIVHVSLIILSMVIANAEAEVRSSSVSVVYVVRLRIFEGSPLREEFHGTHGTPSGSATGLTLPNLQVSAISVIERNRCRMLKCMVQAINNGMSFNIIRHHRITPWGERYKRHSFTARRTHDKNTNVQHIKAHTCHVQIK